MPACLHLFVRLARYSRASLHAHGPGKKRHEAEEDVNPSLILEQDRSDQVPDMFEEVVANTGEACGTPPQNQETKDQDLQRSFGHVPHACF